MRSSKDIVPPQINLARVSHEDLMLELKRRMADKETKAKKVLAGELSEVMYGQGKPIKFRAEVAENGVLAIEIEGHGDQCDGDKPVFGGVPLTIENCEGVVRVVVWGDLEKEDPTHIIPLNGAKMHRVEAAA